MAWICQGTYDPIIAPARIFPRHLHNQALGFLIYFWTPYTSTEFRPIKFVRAELPIPTQNRFGLGRCRHVLQRLSTQAVSDLRQCCFFSFRKQQPIFDLPSQDPVLRRQIFVSQQEFLIDCSRDIGEQARPKHSRASLNLIVEPGLYMLLRFQKPAVRENCETGNQAFSMRLRFLTIRPRSTDACAASSAPPKPSPPWLTASPDWSIAG